MEERGISKRMVEYVLYHNDPTEMHEAGKYPHGSQSFAFANSDPVLTVVGSYEEQTVAIGLAIKKRPAGIQFTIVTALLPESGRHLQ